MEKITRDFVRRPLGKLNEHDSLPLGWFAISYRFEEEMKERRKIHGKWCEISSKDGSIFRAVRFAGELKSASERPSEIILDFPGWLVLSDYERNVDKEVELTIRRARWYQYPKFAISHPDPSYKLASWIGLVSLVLGVLSLVLAIWALFRG